MGILLTRCTLEKMLEVYPILLKIMGLRLLFLEPSSVWQALQSGRVPPYSLVEVLPWSPMPRGRSVQEWSKSKIVIECKSGASTISHTTKKDWPP